MALEGIREFISKEGRTLAAIGIGLLLLVNFLVISSGNARIPPVTVSDVANLIIAIVATSSLYIAWRELIRKTHPNIAVDYDSSHSKGNEGLGLSLTNSGASIVLPENAWYSYVSMENGDLHFSTHGHSVFHTESLTPGDTISANIEQQIVLLYLDRIYIRDWQGDSKAIENFEKSEIQRLYLVGTEGRTQVKVQKILRELESLDYDCSIRIPLDEIQEKDDQYLIREHVHGQ